MIELFGEIERAGCSYCPYLKLDGKYHYWLMILGSAIKPIGNPKRLTAVDGGFRVVLTNRELSLSIKNLRDMQSHTALKDQGQHILSFFEELNSLGFQTFVLDVGDSL